MTVKVDKKIPSNLTINGLTREASPTQYRTHGKWNKLCFQLLSYDFERVDKIIF